MEEKIDYDAEQDVLYYNSGDRVRDSLDIGDIFLEFSGENDVVGVEVLNATETLSELTGETFSPEELSDIQDAELKVHVRGDYAFIILYFAIKSEGELVEQSLGVNVPSNAVSA